jgi:hypothetical protein
MEKIMIPNTQTAIYPGDTIKLNRFDDEEWVVGCGWYSCNGNRPTNGWYLTSKALAGKIKPLNQSDLNDIYLIEPCGRVEGTNNSSPTSIIDDLKSIYGYDETKTQVLMNETGFIHWVDSVAP